MSYTISKKDLIYFVLIGLLLITTSVSFLAYRVAAEESGAEQKKDVPTDQNNDAEVILTDLADSGWDGPADIGIPHLYCDAQMEYTDLPVSTEYNPDFSYNQFFMGNGSSLQDINGDNLPDYRYSQHFLSGAGSELESLHKSCVYLNNGNGWDRAHICYANKRVDTSNGQVIRSEYRGDCADTSVAGSEN